MQPAPQTFKHCAIAPDMLLRREWQGHITYGSAGGSQTQQIKVGAAGPSVLPVEALCSTFWLDKLHEPVCDEVQASCSAASNTLGVTEVFTNL